MNNEFEEQFKTPKDYDEEELHHQEGLSSQKAFQSKVQALTEVILRPILRWIYRACDTWWKRHYGWKCCKFNAPNPTSWT